MRWENERESSNIEDRRGQSGGGGGLPFSVGGGRLSLGTVAVILVGGWLLEIRVLLLHASSCSVSIEDRKSVV